MGTGQAERPDRDDIESLLSRVRSGNPEAISHLIEIVYDDLRLIAGRQLRNESPDFTLQATGLVHEAYIRLVGQPNRDPKKRQDWKNRAHFLSLAARAMRRVLLDYVRKRKADKRGGQAFRVTLSESAAVTNGCDVDVETLLEVLVRMEEIYPRPCEVVKLRFFSGATVPEVAHVLGVSERTVEGDWTFARAWLRLELSREGAS